MAKSSPAPHEQGNLLEQSAPAGSKAVVPAAAGSSQLATLVPQIEALDKFAEENNLLVLTEGKSGFAAAISMAEAIRSLKAMLTPQMMAPIMELQGKTLGFKTDKDATGGYDVETVRDVLIEATIKRFNVYGNQCNIIAGRFYATKEGFEDFFLRQAKAGKVTDLRDTYSAAKIVNENEALVIGSASWKKEGIADKLENVSLQIRLNKGMGLDAVKGKAKRKLLALVYSRVTGTVITEGEASEAATIDVQARNVAEPGAAGATPGQTGPVMATEEQKAQLKEKLEAHANKASTWLLANNAIKAGGSYLDVTAKTAEKILSKPNDFLKAIGAIPE